MPERGATSKLFPFETHISEDRRTMNGTREIGNPGRIRIFASPWPLGGPIPRRVRASTWGASPRSRLFSGRWLGSFERRGGPPSPQPSDKRRSKLCARGASCQRYAVSHRSRSRNATAIKRRRGANGAEMERAFHQRETSFLRCSSRSHPRCLLAGLAGARSGGRGFWQRGSASGTPPCRCWPIRFNDGVSGLSLR